MLFRFGLCRLACCQAAEQVVSLNHANGYVRHDTDIDTCSERFGKIVFFDWGHASRAGREASPLRTTRERIGSLVRYAG